MAVLDGVLFLNAGNSSSRAGDIMIDKLKILKNKFYKYPFLTLYWGEDEGRAIVRGAFRGPALYNSAEWDALKPTEEKLEKKFGKPVTLVNSGRSAIQLALQQTEAKDVLLPSFGCSGILEPVLQAGKNPIFVDIGEDLNVTPEAIENSMTDDCAIIAPSMCGNPVDWSGINKVTQGAFVIDDAAQSMGAKYQGKLCGTFGNAGMFSFNIGKPLTATAGGALLYDEKFNSQSHKLLPATNSYQDLANMILRVMWRKHTLPFITITDRIGSAPHSFDLKGMSILDSELVYAQLWSLDDVIKKRRINASILRDAIDGTNLEPLPSKRGSVYSKFVVKVKSDKGDRVETTKFVRRLAALGVETEWLYKPLHYRLGDFGLPQGLQHIPYTEEIWSKIVTLPVSPVYSEEDMKDIASRVRKAI